MSEEDFVDKLLECLDKRKNRDKLAEVVKKNIRPPKPTNSEINELRQRVAQLEAEVLWLKANQNVQVYPSLPQYNTTPMASLS